MTATSSGYCQRRRVRRSFDMEFNTVKAQTVYLEKDYVKFKNEVSIVK